MLTARGSRSGKINTLLNLMNYESNIDKISLYTKDPCEAKHQLLIRKIKCFVITGLKYFNDSKAFIEYSGDMDDIYKNI